MTAGLNSLDSSPPRPPKANGSEPISLKYWHLVHHKLLSEAAANDPEMLDQVTHLKTISKGEIVYLPGDPANTVYILKQGRVRVSRVSSEGKQMTLLILEPGTIFGEMALLDSQTRHENLAETLEDSCLCWIGKKDFERFLKRHPELNFKILKLMGERLREIENSLEAVVFMSVEQRLQKALRKLAREYGQKTPDGVLIQLRITHEEIGHLINATRPTVTEILQRLQHENKIRIIQRRILVLPSLLKAA